MDSFLSDDKKILVFCLDDGRVLFHQNEKEETKVASLTKIMTVWLALEEKNLGEKIIVNDEMLKGLDDFVVAGLKAGQEISIEELAYLSMLPSAGDAAQALAIATAGSIEKFVEKMNARAKELELGHTHFSNVVGFDEENYSSAEDIGKILERALKNPEFKKIFESFDFYAPSLDKVYKKTFEKSGAILGGKTGFTYEAGRNLASTALVNDANLMVVDLNEAWSTNNHIENTLKIYDYLGENYTMRKILDDGDQIAKITVKDSAQKELEIFATETILRFLRNDEELVYEYNGVNEIDKNFGLGDFLGTYKISTEESGVLYETNLWLEEEIEFYPYWLWNTLVGATLTFLVGFLVVKWRKHKCVRRRGR